LFKIWPFLFISSIFLFLVINFTFWIFDSEKLNLPFPHCGDLSRIAYMPEYSQCRMREQTLPKKHQNWLEFKETGVDVITVGDSFSRGRGEGLNNFYQDYLASKFNVSIGYLEQYTKGGTLNYAESLMVLANSGLLKKLGTKVVILQLAEKNMIEPLARNFDSNTTRPLTEVIQHYDQEPKGTGVSDYLVTMGTAREVFNNQSSGVTKLLKRIVQFLLMQISVDLLEYFQNNYGLPNAGNSLLMFDSTRASLAKVLNINFKRAAHWLAFKKFPQPYFADGYILKMNKPLLFPEERKELFIHANDLKVIQKLKSAEYVSNIHKNLNTMATALAAHGIRLIFLSVPTKYTAYQDYVVDPPDLLKDTFYPSFEQHKDREYIYVNALEAIKPMLESGTTNVFYGDDTHWSNIAIEGTVQLFKPEWFKGTL
jgi:hypothetical protein